MSRAALAAAVAAEQAVAAELDEQTSKLSGLEQQLGPAESAYTQAEQALAQLAGAELLGEAKPAEVAKARTDRDTTRDKRAAIGAAIGMIRQRIEAISERYRTAKIDAEDTAQPVAAELANEELDRVHASARQLGESLKKWRALHAVAIRANITGAHQQRAHQACELLAEHGVRGVEHLQIGTPVGTERFLTPNEVLSMLPKGAA